MPSKFRHEKRFDPAKAAARRESAAKAGRMRGMKLCADQRSAIAQLGGFAANGTQAQLDAAMAIYRAKYVDD